MNINPDSFIHDTIEFVSKLIHENVYDPENARPRANKPGSQKDQEQKKSGKYFFI